MADALGHRDLTFPHAGRRAGGTGLPLVLILLVGCEVSAASDEATRGAEDFADAGTTGEGPGGDGASSADAGAPVAPGDVIGIPADPNRVAPADSEGGAAPLGGRASCFDGQDNDADEAIDCRDENCMGVRACCVGNVASPCCTDLGAAGPLPVALDIAACPDGPARDCPQLMRTQDFGSPGAWIQGGSLRPGGDALGDSGLVVGEPVDLTHTRVRVGARFGEVQGCVAPCLESAGFAFTTQSDLVDVNIRPRAGLLMSGARNDVSLVIADEVVQRWDLQPDATGSEAWALEVQPDGLLRVYRDDQPVGLTRNRYLPAAMARLVLFGRNLNRAADDPDGARLNGVTVEAETCDMPDAWRERSTVTVLDRTTRTPIVPSVGGGDASFAEGATPGQLWMAFEDTGAILLAGQNTDPGLSFTLLHETSLAYDENAELGGAFHPELIRTPAGDGWWVFYTAQDGDGVQSIHRAVSVDDATLGTTLVPDEDGGLVVADPRSHADLVGLEMPTVAVTGDPNVWVMVARATLTTGARILLPFVSWDAGKSFSRYAQGGLEGATERGGAGGGPATGFDAHDVAHPSLIVHGGAYHLYYAGRRGTRWRIGMFASDELVHWRAVGDGTSVLEAAAGEGIAVTVPDAVSRGSEVWLGYAGFDGAVLTPRLTQRSAP